MTVVGKSYHFERVIYLFFNFRLCILALFRRFLSVFIHAFNVNLFEFKPVRNVFVHVKVWEKRVFLEYGVYGALVGRNRSHFSVFYVNITARWRFKACYHTKERRFSASRRA